MGSLWLTFDAVDDLEPRFAIVCGASRPAAAFSAVAAIEGHDGAIGAEGHECVVEMGELRRCIQEVLGVGIQVHAADLTWIRT